jgi:hypothetical protein
MPIALTDAQLDTIMRAATPLAPPDRRAFLAAVADALQGVVEIVSRVCAEQQGGKPNPGSKSNAHHHDAVTSLEVAVGHEVHTPPGFRRPLNCRTLADWRSGQSAIP